MGQRILGSLLLFVALIMLFGFLRARPGGGLVMLITFFLVVVAPAMGGIFLLRGSSATSAASKEEREERKEELRRQTLEAELLKLARHLGGKLTVVEAVTELAFDAATIEEALQRMASEGLAEVKVSDSGVLVYAFYDLEHLSEKESAKSVLDA